MVVHPSQVLSTQTQQSSTPASLTNEQMLAIVWETMKHLTDRRRFERYQAVALMLQRVHYAEIGGIIRRSVTTVCKYIQTYRAGGLPALDLQHSPGRPHRLTEEQEQQVASVVTFKTPQDVGFPANMNWTSPLVRDYIKDTFEVTYSDRGTRGLLYRLGFSCTRPTYTLAKADPAKQAAFRAEFEVVKQQLIDGHIDRILFEDESMIRDYQAIGRTWFPKGQQKQIPTYGKHWGDKLLGILDYETGEVYCEHEEQYTAVEFLRFLNTVVARYAGETLVIVLDNARIHHAKLIQPFLEEHRDHLTMMFLPPYSPQLNLIEGVWGWLKRSVIYNVFFRSVKEIIAAVTTFLKHINDNMMETVDRFCVRL